MRQPFVFFCFCFATFAVGLLFFFSKILKSSRETFTSRLTRRTKVRRRPSSDSANVDLGSVSLISDFFWPKLGKGWRDLLLPCYPKPADKPRSATLVGRRRPSSTVVRLSKRRPRVGLSDFRFFWPKLVSGGRTCYSAYGDALKKGRDDEEINKAK